MTASGEPNSKRRAPLPGAYRALLLLLGINLFNYIDRQILAAVEPSIFETFFSHRSASAMALTGTLGSAFLVSYMLSAPALGWLADRFSRWVIVGCAVIFWSVASGASGLAATFGLLMATRVFVGIGEGGYGPAAPTILADLFPVQTRGRVLAVFCSAIPVGSALGYVIGGIVNTHLGWRWAFYLVTPPGVLLGALCFLQKDPRASGLAVPQRQRARLANYIELFRTRSYVLNTLAQTTMTFAFGGLGFWVAEYLKFRGLPPTATATFGAITAGAGLISTLVGGVIGDRLRTRVPGSYRNALHPLSRGMVPLVRHDLLWISKHGSFKHCARQCFLTPRARDRVRSQHPDYPYAWRRCRFPHDWFHCRLRKHNGRISGRLR